LHQTRIVRIGNLAGFVLCAALIGYALYAQYVLELEPCPLCIFQRVAIITLGIAFLIAGLHNPRRTGARVYGALQLLIALCGIAIAARHIWIQAQPPGTVAACGADLNYMLKILPLFEVINKVLTGSGECATINWQLLGLSMPWWVAFACVGFGAWAVVVNFALPRKLGKQGSLGR
jgi:disulfide bond formation protein DsbB